MVAVVVEINSKPAAKRAVAGFAMQIKPSLNSDISFAGCIRLWFTTPNIVKVCNKVVLV